MVFEVFYNSVNYKKLVVSQKILVHRNTNEFCPVETTDYFPVAIDQLYNYLQIHFSIDCLCVCSFLIFSPFLKNYLFIFGCVASSLLSVGFL